MPFLWVSFEFITLRKQESAERRDIRLCYNVTGREGGPFLQIKRDSLHWMKRFKPSRRRRLTLLREPELLRLLAVAVQLWPVRPIGEKGRLAVGAFASFLGRVIRTYRTAAAATAGRSLHERLELGIKIAARFRLSLEPLTAAAAAAASTSSSATPSSSARASPLTALASSSSSRSSRAASYAAL